MEALLVVVAIYFGVGIIARTLARFEIIWCTIPGNAYAEVISQKNDEGKKVGGASKATAATGGDVVKILHAVPGHKVVKPSSDWMQWRIDPGFQIRGLMYYLYRVHYKGLWWSLAETRIREFRKGMDDEEAEANKDGADAGIYKILRKSYVTKRPWFTRELAVVVDSAETKSGFPLQALLIFKYKVTKPSMVRTAVADTNAVLASFGIQAFKNIVAGENTDHFLYGDPDNRVFLVEEIKRIVSGHTLRALGLTITEVILDDIDVDADTRALLELNRKNELEGNAAITAAEKNAKVIETTAQANLNAKKKQNEGEADYVETVLKPMAADDRMVTVNGQNAYRDNEHVTVFAPGNQNAFLPLSQPAEKKTA